MCFGNLFLFQFYRKYKNSVFLLSLSQLFILLTCLLLFAEMLRFRRTGLLKAEASAFNPARREQFCDTDSSLQGR